MSPSSAGLRISPPDAQSGAEMLEGASDPMRQSRTGSAGGCPVLPHVSACRRRLKGSIAETRCLLVSTVAGNLGHAKWSVPSWRVAVTALSLCYARTAGGSAAPAQPPAPDGLFDGVFGAKSPAVVAAGGAARRGTRWLQRAQPRTPGTQREMRIERRRLQPAGRPAAGAHSTARRGSDPRIKP